MKRFSLSALTISAVFALFLAGCAKTPPAPDLSPSFSTVIPREAEDLNSQAETAYRAGKLPNAIGLWERIAQKFPSTAIAAQSMNRIGEVYLEQGQAERAAQYFDYIIYAYPSWSGLPSTKLNRMKLQAQTGKKKQVMKEAVGLWEAAVDLPEVRLGIAELMIELYGSENDIETAFDWSSSGFSVATTPEQKKRLTKETKEILDRADEGALKKLYKKNPSDFMRVFLDYRTAQIQIEKGHGDQAREQLKAVAAQNPSHPLAGEIQATIRGVKVAEGAENYPLNPDKIGVMVPLNGANAKYGEMVVRGLNLAVSDWTQAHPNQKVTLVIKDAGSEADATRSFGELGKEGVLAIVGPLGTQANKAVVPLANRDGVPLLSLTQKEDEAQDNSFVLHTFIDSRDLVRALVHYCREKLKYERFACLFPEDRYGEKLAKVFAETVQEQGGTMLASASYKEKSTDFTESLQKLLNIAKKNSPTSVTETPFEALFVPDQVSTVALIAPQLPYNNIVGATLLGTNLWSEAPLVQTGGVYVDQAIFATAFYPESRSPKVSAFCERFASTYNTAPSYLEAQAYDALTMLLQARGARGGTDRNVLFQNLIESKNFAGVAGTYTVNDKGDLERQYTILQVVNGALNQVYP